MTLMNEVSVAPECATLYDSTADTEEHIALVRKHMAKVSRILGMRGILHDASKLVEPEKSGFDLIRPRLDRDSIDSDAYKATLVEFEPILRHHYATNSHHPEHFPDGVAGMSLWDIVEMLCDW